MYSALLECTHYVTWRDPNHMPREGQNTWCFRCCRDVLVREVFGPWRALCYHCAGLNIHTDYKATAFKRATFHVQAHPSHRVRVWQYGQSDNSGTLVTVVETGIQRGLF